MRAPVDDGGAALKAVYADPGFRARVKAELDRPVGVRLFNGEWRKLNLLETARAEHRHLEGQSVGALAEAAGQHPLDWMLDLSLAEDLDTIYTAVLLNSDEAAVGRMLQDPHASCRTRVRI